MKIVAREICDCCGHSTNTIQRNVHSEMIDVLRKIHAITEERRVGGEPGPIIVKSADIFPRTKKSPRRKRSTDAVYLVHWNLVVKPSAGEWVLTKLGRAFLAGAVRIPAWKNFRKGVVVAVSEALIGIADVRAKL